MPGLELPTLKQSASFASQLALKSSQKVRIGTILHGAYGDYYEQMVAWRYLKQQNPNIELVVFYANDLRMQELAVYDHSFADEVHPRSALVSVPVDRFFQFQVLDQELQDETISPLPDEIKSQIDLQTNNKPWTYVKRAWKESPELCDLPLSSLGEQRLPVIQEQNQIPEELFENHFTVGFLWRYRTAGGAISEAGQTPIEVLLEERSALFRKLMEEHNAHILVCGMGIKTTDANRDRTDNKYDSYQLDLPEENVTYLQGLSWALELEIIRRCSLGVMMASGFSEALWLKNQGKRIIAVDTPQHYLKKVVWNRVPFFDMLQPREFAFQLRQPHTAERVYNRLTRKNLLPT